MLTGPMKSIAPGWTKSWGDTRTRGMVIHRPVFPSSGITVTIFGIDSRSTAGTSSVAYVARDSRRCDAILESTSTEIRNLARSGEVLVHGRKEGGRSKKIHG